MVSKKATKTPKQFLHNEWNGLRLKKDALGGMESVSDRGIRNVSDIEHRETSTVEGPQ